MDKALRPPSAPLHLHCPLALHPRHSQQSRRRELEALTNEAEALKQKFERLKDDVRVLYGDKANLLKQLQTAQAEVADVEACVAQYRKSAAHFIA